MKEQAAEATIAAVANKVTYGGGATAFIGGITASEFAAFGGLLIAVIGLLVQWYYKRKDDKRNQALHDARMSELHE